MDNIEQYLRQLADEVNCEVDVYEIRKALMSRAKKGDHEAIKLIDELAKAAHEKELCKELFGV